MKTRQTPGERIAALRHTAGMTQKELASKLGTDGPKVSNWENDKETPRLKTALTICRMFGTTVEAVFGDGEE